MNSIYISVYDMVANEKTKIGTKAFNILDREGIADIVSRDGVFWFEFYTVGNNCPNDVYDYLVKFIKRNFGMKYIGELAAH